MASRNVLQKDTSYFYTLSTFQSLYFLIFTFFYWTSTWLKNVCIMSVAMKDSQFASQKNPKESLYVNTFILDILCETAAIADIYQEAQLKGM